MTLSRRWSLIRIVRGKIPVAFQSYHDLPWAHTREQRMSNRRQSKKKTSPRSEVDHDPIVSTVAVIDSPRASSCSTECEQSHSQVTSEYGRSLTKGLISTQLIVSFLPPSPLLERSRSFFLAPAFYPISFSHCPFRPSFFILPLTALVVSCSFLLLEGILSSSASLGPVFVRSFNGLEACLACFWGLVSW